MELKTVAAQTQPTKETSDLGEFEAVFATWDEDREKDIIHPGAFQTTIQRWRRSGKRIPLHWEHQGGPDKIIGHVDPMSLSESANGLTGKGWVDLKNSQLGREAWRLIKAGVMGLSFGYLPTKAQHRAIGGRDLHEVDVFEFTLAPAPMNFDTRILGFKGLDQRSRAELVEREFEDGGLPAVPDAPPEPEPRPEPEPVVVPDVSAQRERAREYERLGGSIRRRSEETRLPDVPEAPSARPAPRPSPAPVPDADRQRVRAREAEGLGTELRRRSEEARLPDVPDVPSVPEAKSTPVEVPDTRVQRERARAHDAYADRLRRRSEEARLPDVPAAPPPREPPPEPEPVPDTAVQRDRAREHDAYADRLRRRSEEARLPSVPDAPPAEPGPESEREQLQIPSAKSQRQRARETERYAKHVARQAEEAQLPDVPEVLADPEPEVEPGIADLLQRIEALETQHVQAEAIDLEGQRQRARTVARETEEGSLMGLVPEQPAAKTVADLLETKVTAEPFSRSRTSNWVARAGGLPHYIQHIAHDMMDERGMSESQAIQMAIGVCKRWCRGGDKVSADTRSKACAAVAEWERLKAKSGKAVSAPADVQALQDVPDSGALADLLDQLSPEELAGLFEALYGRLVDRMGQMMAPGKSLVAAAPGLSPEDADGTGDYRRVDPLRAQADAVELEFVSDGASLRKSPPVKPPPSVPEPELTLEQLTQRMRDEMLRDLSGLDDVQ